MRIIAGKHKGRKIYTPSGRLVRPTKGLLKEAIFNILVHRYLKEDGTSILDGAVVADIFSGTGAIAFEALSRGAKKVYTIDKEKKNLEIVQQNAETLGEQDNIEQIWTNINLLPQAPESCDIIFIDPPYQKGLTEIALHHLNKKGWITTNSAIIVELAKIEDCKIPAEFKLIETRNYGNSKILLLELVDK